MLRGDWSLAGKTYLWMLPIYGLGVLLEPIHDYIPWDYSGKTPYSVLGLIRLDYAPAWFVLGLLFERLHDWLKKIE